MQEVHVHSATHPVGTTVYAVRNGREGHKLYFTWEEVRCNISFSSVQSDHSSIIEGKVERVLNIPAVHFRLQLTCARSSILKEHCLGPSQHLSWEKRNNGSEHSSHRVRV